VCHKILKTKKQIPIFAQNNKTKETYTHQNNKQFQKFQKQEKNKLKTHETHVNIFLKT
jgi:hypothetical protein